MTTWKLHQYSLLHCSTVVSSDPNYTTGSQENSFIFHGISAFSGEYLLRMIVSMGNEKRTTKVKTTTIRSGLDPTQLRHPSLVNVM